jgi:hypothetical protein
VVGLAWSNDLDSYTSSNIATGRSKVMTQINGILWSPRLRVWGMRLTTHHH